MERFYINQQENFYRDIEINEKNIWLFKATNSNLILFYKR